MDRKPFYGDSRKKRYREREGGDEKLLVSILEVETPPREELSYVFRLLDDGHRVSISNMNNQSLRKKLKELFKKHWELSKSHEGYKKKDKCFRAPKSCEEWFNRIADRHYQISRSYATRMERVDGNATRKKKSKMVPPPPISHGPGPPSRSGSGPMIPRHLVDRRNRERHHTKLIEDRKQSMSLLESYKDTMKSGENDDKPVRKREKPVTSMYELERAKYRGGSNREEKRMTEKERKMLREKGYLTFERDEDIGSSLYGKKTGRQQQDYIKKMKGGMKTNFHSSKGSRKG